MQSEGGTGWYDMARKSTGGGTRGEETTGLREARWWRSIDGDKLLCYLCPRLCEVRPGQAGFCFVRQNHDGSLYTLGYGRSTGFAVDPIEKKPLYHFLPGTTVLSFGTAGCNLGCKFCQNWHISKARSDDRCSDAVEPEKVVEMAQAAGAAGIAYTYNEPVIWAEYAIDVARAARAVGLKNVIVTAGYVTPEARPEVFEYMDAANVDLKAFTESFYRGITLSHLAPVLDTLAWLRDTDVWTEITTLLIPGLNDGAEEIAQECSWITEHLGPNVPVHFTAFHPAFKMLDRSPTPVRTLQLAREIAHRSGIRFCYFGNVHDREAQATSCPSCHEVVIRRDWHAVQHYALVANRCPHCSATIPGVFHPGPHRGEERRPFGTPYRVKLT